MAKRAIDLCCDLGEGFGRYVIGQDDEMMKLLSSANVACGFHAGDPHVMRYTVNLAKGNGVKIGAHPGLPDMIGFGRRRFEISASELKDLITYQLGALQAFVTSAGLEMQHVIQHGILTSMVENDQSLGKAIIEAILEFNPKLIYVCLPGSYLPELARKMGLSIALVYLADRAYDQNLRLVNRKKPNAVINDIHQVIERLEELLVTGEVTTFDGKRVSLDFHSILLHGDSLDSLDFAKNISKLLTAMDIEILPLSKII